MLTITTEFKYLWGATKTILSIRRGIIIINYRMSYNCRKYVLIITVVFSKVLYKPI